MVIFSRRHHPPLHNYQLIYQGYQVHQGYLRAVNIFEPPVITPYDNPTSPDNPLRLSLTSWSTGMSMIYIREYLYNYEHHYANNRRVGDGNNVLHDLIIGAAALGINVKIATPPGYEPDSHILNLAQKRADETGAKIEVSNDPNQAAKDTDVIFTDTFVSMGEEGQAQEKLKAFEGYQVTWIIYI